MSVAGGYIEERFLDWCPGASRKSKSAGHSARNDVRWSGRRTADVRTDTLTP
jgi:hypothetical protein